MRAYYVYDEKKDQDHIIIPDADVRTPANRLNMEEFIGVRPDFTRIVGQPLNDLAPTVFGRIVATRDDDGDVCVADSRLWQQRMRVHLG